MYNFSESLHWGSFITTAISINIFWWIWDIPLIWKRGFRAYVDAITWECVRVYMPSVAGVFAIYHTNNRSRWPKLYYFGGRDESLTEGMTDAEVTRIVLTDSLTITATILTISKFYIEPSGLIFTTALWAFPSLQVSLVGICIVGASYTKTCPRRNILIGGALFIFAAGICIGIILMCLSLSHIQAWLPTTMLYFFMASPFCLYTHGALIALIVLVATIARVGGLAVTALIPRNVMPSISLKHPLFGTVYLIVGIAGGILAIYGRFRSRHMCLVLKQGGAETDVKTSMLSNGIASLNALQTRLRRNLQGKHVSEKDGEAVKCATWPQRQNETHWPIIQPPEQVYFSELMAEECTRPSPPVHSTPDVGIRRTISAQQVPPDVIQVVNIPKCSESIDSIFLGDRARARSIRIKRKPVGSGSLKTPGVNGSSQRATPCQSNDHDKYITNIQKPLLNPYQQPNNTNNFSDQKVDRTAKQGLISPPSPQTAARGQVHQPGNKRRAQYFEAETGKVHIGTGDLKPRQLSLKSKPLPKPPPASASTVVKLKN
ncbi:uncharacterized protein BDCG_07525 [Blastomyces dermatitidis ER-3]|uniref:Integral membrane protein n=1 Tax=Ajellomyces dermatitidis (strain ER-3 / ATCC MYA-2586) TaxID=559297 RepID=A0ABP2F708_AJEDR|nr:uncharacterized protein BDCG_07525 [Blastomyces dermatitidis ER-3]EEQ92405.2 hypothetical protein BDCG_07525 [Blastomyces dermatitidis ER-3]